MSAANPHPDPHPRLTELEVRVGVGEKRTDRLELAVETLRQLQAVTTAEIRQLRTEIEASERRVKAAITESHSELDSHLDRQDEVIASALARRLRRRR